MGVCSIEEPVALSPVPPRLEADLDVEHGGNPANRGEPDCFESAELDLRDGLLADAGSRGHVLLAELPALANDTEQPADALIIHGGMVPPTARLRINRRCTGHCSERR
jgi:hypothetical protein